MRQPRSRSNELCLSEESQLLTELRQALPSSFLIGECDIHLGHHIGAGAFGQVFSCTVTGAEMPRAAKVVYPYTLSQVDGTNLVKEVVLWHKLTHPHIVSFIGMSIEPRGCRLVLELCNEGSLEDSLARAAEQGAPVSPVQELLVQMWQVASAMEHVHSIGWMHRDLKPANVLLQRTHHGDQRLKLSDFGLAREKPVTKACLTAETGTYRYMAPEVIRHEQYDEKCDVFSFGLFGYALLARSPPFSALSGPEAAFAVAEGRRPCLPAECPTELGRLMMRAWAQKSEERPSFAEIVPQLLYLVDGQLTLSDLSSTGATPSRSADATAVGVAVGIAPSEHSLTLTQSPPSKLRRELSHLLEGIEIVTLSPSP